MVLLKRNLGNCERGGRPGDGEHIGVVVGVGREHQRDNLRFVAPAGREQRPNRPVDAAAGQHFLFSRLAFALEESPRDAPRRVGVFLVVDRQRKKVDALARRGRDAGGDEHHRVSHPDEDGAIGLLGEFARFDGKRGAVNLYFASIQMHLCLGVRVATCGCPGGGSDRNTAPNPCPSDSPASDGAGRPA